MTGTQQDLYSVGLVLSMTGTQRNLTQMDWDLVSVTGTPQDLYSMGLVLSVAGTQRNLGTGKICCLYFTVCASVLVLSPGFEQDCRTFGA